MLRTLKAGLVTGNCSLVRMYASLREERWALWILEVGAGVGGVSGGRTGDEMRGHVNQNNQRAEPTHTHTCTCMHMCTQAHDTRAWTHAGIRKRTITLSHLRLPVMTHLPLAKSRHVHLGFMSLMMHAPNLLGAYSVFMMVLEMRRRSKGQWRLSVVVRFWIWIVS